MLEFTLPAEIYIQFPVLFTHYEHYFMSMTILTVDSSLQFAACKEGQIGQFLIRVFILREKLMRFSDLAEVPLVALKAHVSL